MASTSGFAPSTWRFLGLSVAASYIGLGSMAIFKPVFTATQLGFWPSEPGTTAEVEHNITGASILLGARDLSIGTALLAFHYQQMPRPMGTLILSGLVLCFVDVVWVWKVRGSAPAGAMAVGATFWGWVGWNLLGL